MYLCIGLASWDNSLIVGLFLIVNLLPASNAQSDTRITKTLHVMGIKLKVTLVEILA